MGLGLQEPRLNYSRAGDDGRFQWLWFSLMPYPNK